MAASEPPQLRDDPSYWQLGSQLELTGCRQHAPTDWNGASRVLEEVMETVLLLHLTALTGGTMTFLKRGYAMEPAGDIVAADPLGRLHLFELKKTAFRPRDVEQLEHYLLGQVFRDPEPFRVACGDETARQLETPRMASYLLGARTGLRMATAGAAFIRHHVRNWHLLVGEPAAALSKTRYGQLSSDQQLRLLHAACSARAAAERGPAPPSVEALLATTRQHAERFTGDLGRLQPRLRLDRPLVLWVVDRRIGGEVLERLRRWRRAGLDARPLVMEVRRNQAGWIARVAGERAPARDDLEQQLLDHLHDHPDPHRPRADLHLYQHARPSDPVTHGGDLRATPVAIIHHDGEPVHLRAGV